MVRNTEWKIAFDLGAPSFLLSSGPGSPLEVALDEHSFPLWGSGELGGNEYVTLSGVD